MKYFSFNYEKDMQLDLNLILGLDLNSVVMLKSMVENC